MVYQQHAQTIEIQQLNPPATPKHVNATQTENKQEMRNDHNHNKNAKIHAHKYKHTKAKGVGKQNAYTNSAIQAQTAQMQMCKEQCALSTTDSSAVVRQRCPLSTHDTDTIL